MSKRTENAVEQFCEKYIHTIELIYHVLYMYNKKDSYIGTHSLLKFYPAKCEWFMLCTRVRGWYSYSKGFKGWVTFVYGIMFPLIRALTQNTTVAQMSKICSVTSPDVYISFRRMYAIPQRHTTELKGEYYTSVYMLNERKNRFLCKFSRIFTAKTLSS